MKKDAASLFELIESCSQLPQSPNLTESLHDILHHAAQILNADAFALWLFASAEMEWKCEIASNLSQKYLRMSAEKYITAALLPEGYKQEDLIVIPEISGVDELAPLNKSEGVQALVSLPLNVSNQRTATIVFFFRKKHKFAKQEIQFCGTIRNAIGASLSAVHFLNAQKQFRLDAEKAIAHRDELLNQGTHRIKNTLQTVASLLSLQSKEVEDPKARDAFEKSIARVRTMIVVHEKFHENMGRKMLSMDKFIHDLARAIFDYFSQFISGVSLKVESDRWGLEADMIAPLGLLLNELISNSLKHAFPGDRKGTITISMKVLTGGKFELLYADDGIGMSPLSQKSFGLRLIALLADQLGADSERLEVPVGAAYRFVFGPHKNHRNIPVFS